MSARLLIGTPDPADLALGLGRVGVVAHLGRQVEGDRQAGLALLEQVAEALGWSRLGGREAGVLAHRPEPAPVHRRLDAAGERELARPAEVAVLVEAGHVGRRVQVADLDARARLERARGARGRPSGGRPGGRRASDRRPGSGRRSGRSPEDHQEVAELDASGRPRPATRSTVPARGRAKLVLHLHRLDHDAAAGRPRRRRPAATATATIRPGMIGPDLDRPAGAPSGSRSRGRPARAGPPEAASSSSTSNRQPSTTTSRRRCRRRLGDGPAR